ncbi:MAG TPA: Trm112 family protein [Thermoguttaceae bacterium]|nr:Trm112 family protein [Thermoguttaceae bacterium]
MLNGTMIDPLLLDILVCPANRTRLRPAEAGLLAKVNEAIAAGRVRTTGGQPVAEPLVAGLVREDGAVLYPIVDDIPVMLVDEAVRLDLIS